MYKVDAMIIKQDKNGKDYVECKWTNKAGKVCIKCVFPNKNLTIGTVLNRLDGFRFELDGEKWLTHLLDKDQMTIAIV